MNPGNLDLLALLNAGVDIGAFVAAADKATNAGRATFHYVLGIVGDRLRRPSEWQRMRVPRLHHTESAHRGFPRSKNYREGTEDGTLHSPSKRRC